MNKKQYINGYVKGLHVVPKGTTQLLVLCCISTLVFVPVGNDRVLEAPKPFAACGSKLYLDVWMQPTTNTDNITRH